MVRGFPRQPVPRIRDLYHGVLDMTLRAQDIEPLQQRPSHVVLADASFQEVVQHTDWWLRRNDNRPHYRYRRYREILGGPQQPRDSNTRLAHVDMGCGAGLFAWVLLDWARDSNLAYDRIDLYGLDHSPEMINLAYLMRARLTPVIIDYPTLHYTNNVEILLRELTAHHQVPADYIITFGHVLAQAHTNDAILIFARVIVHIILELIDDQSNCAMVAVDAQRWSNEFASGWNALLTRLTWFGIRHQEITINPTSINDGNRAKIARLFPIGK